MIVCGSGCRPTTTLTCMTQSDWAALPTHSAGEAKCHSYALSKCSRLPSVLHKSGRLSKIKTRACVVNSYASILIRKRVTLVLFQHAWNKSCDLTQEWPSIGPKKHRRKKSFQTKLASNKTVAQSDMIQLIAVIWLLYVMVPMTTSLCATWDPQFQINLLHFDSNISLLGNCHRYCCRQAFNSDDYIPTLSYRDGMENSWSLQ